MPSPWNAIADATTSTIDGVFHEEALITPMASPSEYVSGSPDPQRPAFSAMVGVEIDDRGHDDVRLSGNGGSGWNAGVSLYAVRAWVDTATYPAASDLVEGDRVTLKERGGATYTVANALPWDLNRIMLELNRV
ncbi:MAG: hypothetical protein ROR55_21040 [Devosia sp.]